MKKLGLFLVSVILSVVVMAQSNALITSQLQQPASSSSVTNTVNKPVKTTSTTTKSSLKKTVVNKKPVHAARVKKASSANASKGVAADSLKRR